jgi:hypothetical protein
VCCVLSGRGLSVLCVVCCQVEVVQSSLTDCSASLCVITKRRERGGHSLRWAAEPEMMMIIIIIIIL